MRKSGACRLSKFAIDTVDSRMQRTREWLESHVPACNDEYNENSTDSSIELFRKDQSFSNRVKEKLKQCDLEPCISPDHPFVLGVTETENENCFPPQLDEITPLICPMEEKLDTGSEGEPSLIMRNDVPKYLSSTKQKGVEVNLDSAAEWADLSSITPSPRTAAYRARMIAETTPYKISQPSAVNAPIKVKQPNSKWKRGSQPLSSTCLFKSPDVEIVDCLPDVSSIRSRDGVSMSDVCLAEQKKQMFTQEGVMIRKCPDLSYNLPVHDLREPKDMEGRKMEQNPVKVLTSTPAKDFVHNNLLKKLQIDVSFVPPPSSDEDVPLDFNHSPRTVNSDEIAPLNLEEIEDNPCFGLQQDEEH
ncbi:hypothetical protein ACJMK2_037365 [Sinanodonta woodiana]|uniref:Uncharacterized protein n=1 Tax=Sinanodonta woodiana TaxID=1069815 RepID=A0ABD3WLG4_SINWO